MGIFEIILSGLLVFSAGTYLGRESGKKEQDKEISRPKPLQTPDTWHPTEHYNMIKTCGLVCGENRLKSYTIVYGKCECTEK